MSTPRPDDAPPGSVGALTAPWTHATHALFVALSFAALQLLLSVFSACADQVVGWPVGDDTAPTVTATSPASNAVDQDPELTVSATFSEAMDPATIDGASFTLADGTTAVPGTVSYDGFAAHFIPTAPLALDTEYTATLHADLTDVGGTPMAAPYVWRFTIRSYVDDSSPLVIATSPAMGAVGVATNAVLGATFSEAMDPASLTAATFTVRAGTTPIAGTVAYVGVTATFTPTTALPTGTLITATISDAATDLAGNPLAQDYVWVFTTGIAADTTAPTVTSTTPTNNAVAVGFNTPVAATFSEAMSPATINATSFTLSDGVTPVAGTVLYVGLTALFIPAEALAPSTRFTATVKGTVADLAGNLMVADYVWHFTTGVAPDELPPVVSSTFPMMGATDVGFNTSLTATFSEPMAPLSLTNASFTVTDGITIIAGAVTTIGSTATFDPTLDLLAGTTYTARIRNTVTDLAGNAMVSDYVWTFTTSAAPDTTRPSVTFTFPASGATEVALNTALSATFTEVMDPASITTATFTLAHGGTAVAGNVSSFGFVATFIPSVALLPNTLYTATIRSQVKDLAGNTMAADYVWSFTTGPAPDLQRPTVIATFPRDDAAAVPFGSSLTVVFSEAMDPASITTVNFTVQQGSETVSGTVTYVNFTATFTPNAPLTPDTEYAATVTTSTRDLAGNALVSNYVWNFHTGLLPDATRPQVIATEPTDLETGVALNRLITATFSEAMNPLTLTNLTFTVKAGVTPVLGTVFLFGNVAVFDPLVPLLPGTEYTATVTNQATDLVGNALLAPYTWHFTTGVVADTTRPTIILKSPLPLATNVPIGASVNATFSEAMNPLSITASSFTLTGPGLSPVAGVVSYDALTHVATFDPTGNLEASTLFTATVTNVAKDLAGNSLLVSESWTFTTGLSPGLQPLNLGTLVSFAAAAGSGLTNSNSAGITVINGDVALSPTGTCMGDGSPCTLINPVINGVLYQNDPAGVAVRAKADLASAYNQAMAQPPGTLVNDISGLTLIPGVYTSASTMSVAVGGTVTLDAQGDANAIWIFQIGSSLTVNNSAKVLLINGAKAKNVFWAAFASSTLGNNVAFQGTVLAGASNSVGTGSTVIGRLLCMNGQITLLSNTITLPPL
ncbi:MAG: Ig-like domain-containing protein [Deltaproteobacteria bacterium]|nr:Ig-like domain-containing protein [Deltaproteobacteria bacterium]